jgi:hypothetical protein
MLYSVKCYGKDETITTAVEAKDSLEAVRKARVKHPGYRIGAVRSAKHDAADLPKPHRN